ncbi:Methyltransferase domain-containing protein [Algoriphagus alkaliphilus]|uniref:Methyltransferase domain-containing protein n=1 Tax=Algoriphagus alkaliphilus TaxID=279824 RepID=A0A1G5YFR7_9BACT|nr:methyltransferase domain-containing protein [Algoriphagus alkaliphilus]MBA4300046.1 methyltransferase domain-containing protein [Cyclobacterium sp.]SDA81413.1 Methyltransferase domain-containing protein [Algoriphagus alkaliphilus]
MSKFDKRSEEKELMDDLECSGQELKQTLRELKTINHWLGGNHVTTNGLAKIMKLNPQSSYRIADIGCGGGDMIRIMNEWAESNKKQVDFVGIDANINIIELAKVRLNDVTNVNWQVQNVFEPEFSKEKVDIITCTLFTHHFTDAELITLIQSFRQKSNLGLVINDLHRHWFAFHSIRILTKLFSKSQMVQHDASLSVLRSFQKADLERILAKAGIKTYQISWFWAFRWQVLVLF